ncbi:tRNA pseudouridine(55) synthase TruB [Spirulina sp. 06S082]|uniref:tRNA pseudouridine(55) synthase TruB n=1 Tax=Spirulina sp. 06S082 TaxID=3110248 RepID=UPI002B21442B|nr:tRNA pseudouridine(55) synthase TruB [Spirulina sp. 06S082]MEA5469884.1 tRNA pseudouridine(55) synthase TruB [Spirulina sp. 06S082]
MLGFLNLNKPAGFTSHDCVAQVRRLLKLKRVGHGGTLDPAATGVLPIAIGRATRLLQYLPEEKAYHARVRFGWRTTTDDLEGEVLEQRSHCGIELEQIQTILPQFIGKIEQIPPIYSAIQRGGKRMYELARAGEKVDVPPRIVEIQNIKILSWNLGEFPELEVAITCGGGTYIRAIARDLGDLLGTGGTLAKLVRTKSCGLELVESITLEELENAIKRGEFQPIAPEVPLEHLEAIALEMDIAKRWCQGQKIPAEEWVQTDKFVRVYDLNKHFLGIGQQVNTDGELQLIPKTVLMG